MTISNITQINYSEASDKLTRLIDQPGRNTDEIINALKGSAEVFAKVALSAEPPPSLRQRNVSDYNYTLPTFSNDPFFWYWLGRMDSQSRYQYHHPVSYPSVAMSADRTGCCGSCNQECKGEVVVVLAIAFVVLSDIVAFVTGAYYTASAAKEAYKTSNQAEKHRALANTLNTITDEIPCVEGDGTKFQISQIGERLTTISNRMVQDKTREAVYTAILSIAGLALTHAIVSGIAVSIISSSAAALATTSGVNAIAFFSFCYSPPILVVIATISALGIALYVVSNRNQELHSRKNVQDAQDGLMYLRALARKAEIEPRQVPDPSSTEGRFRPQQMPDPSAPFARAQGED